VRNIDIKAGRLFCFTSGEYSDYSLNGFFLALVDITRETLDAVKATLDEEEYIWAGQEEFISALIKSGAVMVIDCEEIHCGSYGELSY
jgi:hypothetical protein